MRIIPLQQSFYSKIKQNDKLKQNDKNESFNNVNFEGKFLTKKGYYLTALFAGVNVARSLFPGVSDMDQQEAVKISEPGMINQALEYSKMHDSVDIYQAKKSFIDKFMQHPLKEYETIVQMVTRWLVKADTIENVDKTLPIMDLIMDNEILYDNKYIKLNLDDIALDCSDDAVQAKKYKQQLLELYLKTPELQKEPVENKIASIVAHTDYKVEYELASMVLNNKILYENGNILANLQENSFDVDVNFMMEESYNAKRSILDLYLANPDLQENFIVSRTMGGIIKATTPQNSKLSKFALSDKKIVATKTLVGDFAGVLKSVDKEEILASKIGFLNMLADSDVKEKMPIGEIFETVENENQLTFIGNIAKTPRLLQDSVFMENLAGIVYNIETRADLDLTEALISKESLIRDGRVLHNLAGYITDIKGDDNIRMLVEHFLNEKDDSALLTFFKVLDRISY